jgi:hypothetical protein
VIWKVSPAVTAADEERAPVHKQLPEVEASHADQCVYVSVVLTLVHVIAAEIAIDPEEAADQAATVRVAFVAAAVVPSSPASAVWSLM